MKSFLKLLAAGLVACSISDSYAQTRDLGARRLLLDDNAGGRLTMSYAGPGNSNFVIPSGSDVTTVPLGTLIGQTLAWDGTEWQAMSNMLNTGGNVSMPTGDLTLTTGTFTGDGSGITDLDASNVTTGSLDLARISTTGATNSQVLTYDGANLVYADPAVFTLPYSATQSNATSLFSITNTEGTGTTAGAASFGIDNAASQSSALTLSHNGDGRALEINTTGTGTAAGIQSIAYNNGIAGNYQTDNPANTRPTLRASNINGSGPAGVFMSTGTGSGVEISVNSSFNTKPGLQVGSNGLGPASSFQNLNPLSTGPLILVSTTSAGLGIDASTYGTGGIGLLVIDNAFNTSTVLEASTNGLGNVAKFTINNIDNNSPIIEATTNGTGRGIGVTTTGTGRAAQFTIDNAANSSTALEASTNGSGSVAQFTNTNSGSFSPTVAISTNGSGRGLNVETSGGNFAAYIANTNPSNHAPALRATSNGNSSVAYFTSLGGNNVEPALDVSTDGTGNAARFLIDNSANTSPSLYVSTNGLGRAGSFSINNAANIHPAIYATSNGNGYTIHSINTGNGYAGFYAIDNAASGATSLHARTNGIGHALSAYAQGTNGSAGHFITSNSTNPLPTIFVEAAHIAPGMFINQGGEGHAGSFRINNPTGAGNVVHASTNGTGNAGFFEVTNSASTNEAVEMWSNAANQYVARIASTGSASTNGLQITAGTTAVGLNITSGSLITSYASIAHNTAVPDNATVVHVGNNAGGAAGVSAMPSGVNGKLLYITTSDVDGITINGVSTPQNRTRTWVYTNGAWSAAN